MGKSGTFTFYPAAFEIEADANNDYLGRAILRASEAGATSGAPPIAGARIDGVEVVTAIFNADPVEYEEQGAIFTVYLASRVDGVEDVVSPGQAWTSDEQTIGGSADRWDNAASLSQAQWLQDPTIVYEIDATGTQGPGKITAATDDTGSITIHWRRHGMHVNPDACFGAGKIAHVLRPLLQGEGRVSLGLIGDSTVVYAAHGWDAGIRLALFEMGLKPYGSGLHGCGEGSGVGWDCLSSPNTQNGAYSSLPAEWQAWARNKSGEAGYLGCLDNWFITSNQAGGNFGFFIVGHADFITEAMSFKLWYATTTQTTAGSSIKVTSRKQMANLGYHTVHIENFTPNATNTFSLVIQGQPTSPITFSATAATLNAAVKSAIEAIAGGTVTVSATTSYPGYVSMIITRSTGADLGAITIDASGMRPKFCGRPVVSRVYPVASGSGGYSAIGSEATLDADQAAATQIAVYERSIPASSTRDFDVGVMPNPGSTTGVAPFLTLFYGVTAPGRASGFSITPIVALGGQSTRVHATRLQNQTDQWLTEFFRAWAQHDGAASPGDHRRLIIIHNGLNDQNDANNSVGPNPAATNTRAGAKDNLAAIVRRLDQIHEDAGWRKGHLCYLIMLPQPTAADDAGLIPYRLGARDFVASHPRAALVDLNQIHGGFATDVGELSGWTGSANDYPHPHAAGFTVYARYAFESLLEAIDQARPGRGDDRLGRPGRG